MLICHSLGPIFGDNILSPDQATLAVGLMKGFGIDITNIISQENQDRSMFPCLVTKIFLKGWVPILPGVDDCIVLHCTMNLGFIKDPMNLVLGIKL